MKSWQTTLMGTSAIFIGVGLLIKAIVDGDMESASAAISGIVVGFGLVRARDNNKSSEDVKIK